MDGVVNLLKPPGISSNTAVNIVKGIFDAKKAGHTGTLDPGAAGVLAVCLNRATRLVDYLMDSRKKYIAEISFGVSTTTQDAFGQAEEMCDERVCLAELESALKSFCGLITQQTPAYSAAKHNGVPLYKLARRGEQTAVKTREVRVESLRALKQTGNGFLLEVACSKGTYVRTLCADIGKALRVPAHMSFLLRTETSGLCVENAVTFDELRELRENSRHINALIAPDAMLAGFDKLELAANEAKAAFNGLAVERPESDGHYRVYFGGGFAGIGRMEANRLKMATLFLER